MKVLLLPLALWAVAATAQAPDRAACGMRPATVPGFEGWSPADPADGLAVGRKAALMLAPAATLEFVPPLARSPQPGTFGATFPLRIATAGRYRIALSAGAWIDVVGDGRRLESVAHGHGLDCSGIAKIVAFDLKPGIYLVQLSEARSAALGAMVIAG